MPNIGKALLAKHGLDRGLRIAVVKPDVHNDLYYRVSPDTPADIVYSSILRSGPVALFTALDADYYVVKTDDEDEGAHCWREKADYCMHHPASHYDAFRGTIRRFGLDYDHAAVSIDAAEVDWSLYDVVITFDCAVPARVRKEHTRPVWCYYVSEGCMPLRKASVEAPQYGYDLFLNLGMSVKRQYHLDHEIEFPYFLQYCGCFEDLDGIKNPAFAERDLLSCERHTRKSLSAETIARLEKFGRLFNDDVTPRDLVASLRRSKFLLRLNAKPLWGNSLIEAMAAGVLVIASPETLKFRSMIKDLWADDVSAAIVLMRKLEEDASFRQKCLTAQTAQLNEIAFLRPIRDLYAAVDRLRPDQRHAVGVTHLKPSRRPSMVSRLLNALHLFPAT